ncbi:MAG: hypothetical protein RL839_00470 [Gammaproteobacteria bacterium]
MPQRKIILFELNEVPFRIFHDYCEKYPNGNFNVLRRNSSLSNTYSPDIKSLSPWSTWPTLHRGVDSESHTLTNLSQDLTEIDAEFPPVWKILNDEGVRIGLGGSLHTWPPPQDRANYEFYLPDTFATDASAFPKELKAFQQFNLAMVDRSARNVSRTIPLGSSIKVLGQFPKLGITGSTVTATMRHLLSEIVTPELKNRRRSIQSMLAFDAFMKQLNRTKPDFCTYFTNHVASAMHRYWAAKYPGDFENNSYASDWVGQYRNEIDFAMSAADLFLGRLLNFVDLHREYKLVIVTSMGQAAFDGTPIHKQVYVKSYDKFLNALGLNDGEWSRRRVMLPRFAFVVNDAHVQRIEKLLDTIKISGSKVAWEKKGSNYFMLHFGQPNLGADQESIVIGEKYYEFDQVGIENTVIEDSAGSSGYHIPEGLLIVYDPLIPRLSDNSVQISTTEVAPAILKNFNVRAPAYMPASTSELV